MPDYVVCFDTFDDKDRIIARELNIPIVIINSKKYNKNVEKLEGIGENNYLSGNEVNDYDILKDIKTR
jgi:hypothetical protein